MACVVSCHVMQCDVMVISCTTPVLPCITKYYSSTTLYYSSTTLYYKVLLQYYPVLQSTTPVLTFLTSFEKLPNYEIYRERYLQIYIYTLIYKVYTNALYIIPFCLHLVNCCRGKFTSTANRSNAYVYDTVMCQWCLWL